MLFYFIRHGQTDANLNELLAGSGLDHELNRTGHDQARELGRRLAREIDIQIERLIVSDMIRARQTAHYIAQALGLDPQLHSGFREWHLGEWEGKSFSEFAHLLLGDGEPTEGESRSQFYGRVEKAWRDVHHDEEPYAIVSHGAVWLAIQDFLKIPRFKITNCDLIRVQSSSGVWQATRL